MAKKKDTEVKEKAVKSKAVKEKVEKVATEEVATEEVAQLTLQDLQSLVNVVDVACHRGAFRGNDMIAVGTVYNKLTGFLNYISKTNATDEESKIEQE